MARRENWEAFLPEKAILMRRQQSALSAQSTQSTVTQSVPGSPDASVDSIAALENTLSNCVRCRLGQTRKTVVFGDGNPLARLVFVGEAPGEQEDESGLPFVGPAGQLLDKMIAAMGLSRQNDVYICNIIKCRPPEDRDPASDEIATCSPFLIQQLGYLKPALIVTLGAFATQHLLQSAESISKLRGQFQDWNGIKLLPTFHPAYLLRQPSAKREAWADLQAAMRFLNS